MGEMLFIIGFFALLFVEFLRMKSEFEINALSGFVFSVVMEMCLITSYAGVANILRIPISTFTIGLFLCLITTVDCLLMKKHGFQIYDIKNVILLFCVYH